MTYKMTMFVLSQIRKFSTTSGKKQQKCHYDSLGLVKSATQAEVKSAYYQLSKVYHPDRNQGETAHQREEHSQKFRDITEAYEVLGNVQSRKMYDKGFLGVRSHSEREQSKQDPLHKFYKSRDARAKAPPPSGSQPIYDFDEWARMHYGETLRKAHEMKARKAFHEEQYRSKKQDVQQEIFAYGGIVVIIICMLFKESMTEDNPRNYQGGDKARTIGK